MSETSETRETRPAAWMTPASILVGAAMIALGLYFGLRARAPEGASSSASSATTAAPAGHVSSASAPPVAANAAVEERTGLGTPAPPVRTQASAQVTAQGDAAKAIETLRHTIATRCFEPHKNDPGAPKSVKLSYSGGFDAQGVEIARGLSDDRSAFFLPVSKCARELPMDLKIPPPGVNVSVVVPFEVP